MNLKAAIQVAGWLNKDASNQAKVQHSICGAEDRLKTIQNRVQGMPWGLISLTNEIEYATITTFMYPRCERARLSVHTRAP